MKDINLQKLNKPILLYVSLLAVSCRTANIFVTGIQSMRTDSSLSADPGAGVFLKPWKDSLGGFVSQVIGRTDTAYYAERPSGNLDNLCADLMLRFGDSACMALNGYAAHFSLLNNGGLRNPLPAGEIRLGHLFELMPFENEAVLLKISGQTADSVFSHVAKRGGEPVSGLRLEVSEIGTVTAWVRGARFDSRREYWVVTSDYLAQGGDGFGMLRSALQRVELKRTVRDVFVDGIRAETREFGAVQRRNERRIVYANEANIPQK